MSNSRQRRQQHLLDVKVRSRRATQHRNRRVLVVVSKIVLVVGLCFGVYIGVREGARKFFFENPSYRLSQIDVQTDGTLQREQILKTTGLREGENIFRVNLARVHDALQQLPQVDEVQITRKLPSEIDIRITERKPVAWITGEKQITDPFAAEGAFLVDGRGVLMKEKKLLPEYLGLPLITGCTSEALEAGKVVGSLEARAALELLLRARAASCKCVFRFARSMFPKVIACSSRTRTTPRSPLVLTISMGNWNGWNNSLSTVTTQSANSPL